MKLHKIALCILSAFSLLIANSCAPSTPASRIAQNPVLFEKLSAKDKELAQHGQIKRGMHRDGVLLAWGQPSGMNAGSRKGKSYEKWIYTTSTPVYTNRFCHYTGYGGYRNYGYRGYNYGYGRGFYQGFSYGPEVHYVSRTAATVEFNQYNKVSDWSSRR